MNGMPTTGDVGSIDASSFDVGADVEDGFSGDIQGAACGQVGMPCCCGNRCLSAPGLRCLGGICRLPPPTPCGGRGQACCAGDTCDEYWTCSSGICTDYRATCGEVGEPCCCDATCNTGLTCLGADARGIGGKCWPPSSACGGNGQPCCCDVRCNSGMTCTNGTCAPPSCGAGGLPCCSGGLCRGGLTCVGAVSGCGAEGQACCSRRCQAGLACDAVDGGALRCVRCGGVSQLCCQIGGPACNPGLVCGSVGRCTGVSVTTCGGLGQSCCSGGICNMGLACSGYPGTCVACGGRGQPYCGSPSQCHSWFVNPGACS